MLWRVARPAAQDGFVEIVVEDNGPGIPPAVVERIARLREGRPSTIRGGFGLVIAYNAVRRLGGKLWIDRSSELGGAAIHLTLPAALESNPHTSANLPQRHDARHQ